MKGKVSKILILIGTIFVAGLVSKGYLSPEVGALITAPPAQVAPQPADHPVAAQ